MIGVLTRDQSILSLGSGLSFQLISLGKGRSSLNEILLHITCMKYRITALLITWKV